MLSAQSSGVFAIPGAGAGSLCCRHRLYSFFTVVIETMMDR